MQDIEAYGALGLVDLVTCGILCSLSTRTERCVGIFGDVLVGLLAGTAGCFVEFVTNKAIERR